MHNGISGERVEEADAGLFDLCIRLILTLMHVVRRLMQAIDEEGMYIGLFYLYIRSLLPMY